MIVLDKDIAYWFEKMDELNARVAKPMERDFVYEEIKRRATAKPAPAPGAEAAIEALVPSEREYLRVYRTREGGWIVMLEHDVDGGYSEGSGPSLSAALAALRGEAGK